jgi:hypothetical protein
MASVESGVGVVIDSDLAFDFLVALLMMKNYEGFSHRDFSQPNFQTNPLKEKQALC